VRVDSSWARTDHCFASGYSLSGRTLQDDELVLPIVDKLTRVRTNTVEGEDALVPLRPKAKHRTRPPLKFILKVHTRSAPCMWSVN
jgi:hypothetical protein